MVVDSSSGERPWLSVEGSGRSPRNSNFEQSSSILKRSSEGHSTQGQSSRQAVGCRAWSGLSPKARVAATNKHGKRVKVQGR